MRKPREIPGAASWPQPGPVITELAQLLLARTSQNAALTL
jgi:hypothetical protein